MQGAERKLATMVFADVVGSTELATALDPEDFRARLEPFFDVARDVLSEYGGTLEKFIGDAVVAVFGVPRSHGDDPDRAVAAALELIRRLDERGDGLALRIGIDTGEVLAVEGGGDLDIAGEAVNAAARLQTAAQPGEVLVGERTARSCRASELEPHEPVAAKGFPAPLAAWRAVGIASKARLAVTPFLGRAVELDLLRLAYRRAITRRAPELVTLTGDAGLGKTRLAYELFAELRDLPEPPRILLGHNPAYGRGIAFWALGEVLRDAAGVGADSSVGTVRAALEERLSSLGATDAGDLAGALSVPLGGDGSDGGEDSLKRAWRRLVALLAEDRPLVIGFDDIQWADDGLLDMIEEVTLGLVDAPLLIVCTSRPELAESRPGFGGTSPNVTRVELRPLSEGAATELAAALLPTASRHLAAKVAQTSGGNPFFAEEVSCRIADDPDAVMGDDRPIPETVHAAIAARLDRLATDEKQGSPARGGARDRVRRRRADRPRRRARRRRACPVGRQGARHGACHRGRGPLRVPAPADPRRRLRVAATGRSRPPARDCGRRHPCPGRLTVCRAERAGRLPPGARRRLATEARASRSLPTRRRSRLLHMQCSAARPPDPRSCTSRRPAWRQRSSSGSTPCGRPRASPCDGYAVTRRCACAGSKQRPPSRPG